MNKTLCNYLKFFVFLPVLDPRLPLALWVNDERISTGLCHNDATLDGQFIIGQTLEIPLTNLQTKYNHMKSDDFSPFAAVSKFRVAGLAETFPSFSVSCPFLLDFPGFQVPSDSIVPPQLLSSSRALPLHLHFCNCSDVFSFISSFDVPEPFQPSPSHNHRYLIIIFHYFSLRESTRRRYSSHMKRKSSVCQK